MVVNGPKLELFSALLPTRHEMPNLRPAAADKGRKRPQNAEFVHCSNFPPPVNGTIFHLEIRSRILLKSAAEYRARPSNKRKEQDADRDKTWKN
jgi:hypothetical protein